jgi:formylmethanofuran--tetrahydromethanopterin N-formyltransferase
MHAGYWPLVESPRAMRIKGTLIEDTHAEAFRAWASRLIVTGADRPWAVDHAVRSAIGYGTSVIGCDAEAGLERWLDPAQTPDGRPGAAMLFFARQPHDLASAVANRAGQCLMTCPTTAVFDGLPGVGDEPDETRFELGDGLRFFGDGYQEATDWRGRRCWKVPVMDGDFLVEATAGAVRGCAGGNFLICGRDQMAALSAAQQAVAAIAEVNHTTGDAIQPLPTGVPSAPCPGVITPFPGGMARSGSKVGGRYEGMGASTNDAFCPTLRDRVQSRVPAGANCLYEIVIDGMTLGAVMAAMRAGIVAACGPGVVAISAGNYGGKLGKVNIRLHEVLQGLGTGVEGGE